MKNKIKIAIIDYKMSNLFSIDNALTNLGFESIITSNNKIILEADGVILPGVGSFHKAMKNLIKLDLVNTIKESLDIGKPFMGICLGLQLLFTKSEEFEECSGLNIVSGSVLSFKDYIKAAPIPHVGWNSLKLRSYDSNNSNFNYTFLNNEYFYFIHSYFVKPKQNDIVLSYTKYENFEFCSSISKGNLFACQFHPEKSGVKGLTLLNNFFKGNKYEI
tara:strand:- start:1817 stop:2470 length:654 start_codon:yes stop_codon:yes gene_type:complete